MDSKNSRSSVRASCSTDHSNQWLDAVTHQHHNKSYAVNSFPLYLFLSLTLVLLLKMKMLIFWRNFKKPNHFGSKKSTWNFESDSEAINKEPSLISNSKYCRIFNFIVDRQSPSYMIMRIENEVEKKRKKKRKKK